MPSSPVPAGAVATDTRQQYGIREGASEFPMMLVLSFVFP